MLSRGTVGRLLLPWVNNLLRRFQGHQLTSDGAATKRFLRHQLRSSYFLLNGVTKTKASEQIIDKSNSRRSTSSGSSSVLLTTADILAQGSNEPRMERVRADTDDLHSIGQKPITFLRQVVALATHPALLSSQAFPEDAKARAARILNSCYGNSIGAYTEGPGIKPIRKDVADYIRRRDGGTVCHVDDVFLTTGAADAIDSMLTLLCTGRGHPNQAGILIPSPGYPNLRNLVVERNSYPISYYLDEDDGWDITIEELQSAMDSAQEHCQPRALVLINPSNPTGHVFSKRSIENVIRFAHREHLLIIADEVFQQSVFGSGAEFHSVKKVLVSMGEPYENMQLASVMSASKGITAECGFRAGYCEFINLDQETKDQLIKYVSAGAKSCATVPGQIALDVVVNPPLSGDPSYTQFQQETGEILSRLRAQATISSRALNAVEGISCVEPAAANFLFPRIQLPMRATQEAKDQGLEPDEFYCRRLLEETRISLNPGTEFGQKCGHHHFRLTMLPSLAQMEKLLEKLINFHRQFLSFYSSD